MLPTPVLAAPPSAAAPLSPAAKAVQGDLHQDQHLITPAEPTLVAAAIIEEPQNEPALNSEIKSNGAVNDTLTTDLKESSLIGGLKKPSKRKRPFTWTSIKEAGPVAKLALFTGAYISVIGLALLVAPLRCFTLLFDQRWGARHETSLWTLF